MDGPLVDNTESAGVRTQTWHIPDGQWARWIDRKKARSRDKKDNEIQKKTPHQRAVVPTWFQHGSNMVPTWPWLNFEVPRLFSRLALLFSPVPGPKMVVPTKYGAFFLPGLAFFPRGRAFFPRGRLVPTWFQHGSNMVPTWFQHGSNEKPLSSRFWRSSTEQNQCLQPKLRFWKKRHSPGSSRQKKHLPND